MLAAVALPSYQSSVRKARRADARSALVTTAQLMERYSTEHGGTGYSTATLSTVPGRPWSPSRPATTATTCSSLANLAAAPSRCSAVPQGGQAADACATFTLDERGVRGLTGSTLAVADCW